MENTSNSGEFKDLLSAALSQSGVTDDLDEYINDFSGFPTVSEYQSTSANVSVPTNRGQYVRNQTRQLIQPFQQKPTIQIGQNIQPQIIVGQSNSGRQVLTAGPGNSRSGSPHVVVGPVTGRSASPHIILSTTANSRSASPHIVVGQAGSSSGSAQIVSGQSINPAILAGQHQTQQLRRVIIKTPQGQQQVLQRIVTGTQSQTMSGQVITARPSSNVIGQLSNPRSTSALIALNPTSIGTSNVSRFPGTPRFITNMPSNISTPHISTKINPNPSTPMKHSTINPEGTPKLVSRTPGSEGTPTRLVTNVTGIPSLQQVHGTPKIIGNTKTPVTIQHQQGTPKIVKIRPVTSNSITSSPIMMNQKGGAIRVIKIPKSDSTNLSGTSLSAPSTATPQAMNSGPRIVKIMTTPKGSTPVNNPAAVKRVIMQSFQKPPQGVESLKKQSESIESISAGSNTKPVLRTTLSDQQTYTSVSSSHSLNSNLNKISTPSTKLVSSPKCNVNVTSTEQVTASSQTTKSVSIANSSSVINVSNVMNSSTTNSVASTGTYSNVVTSSVATLPEMDKSSNRKMTDDIKISECGVMNMVSKCSVDTTVSSSVPSMVNSQVVPQTQVNVINTASLMSESVKMIDRTVANASVSSDLDTKYEKPNTPEVIELSSDEMETSIEDGKNTKTNTIEQWHNVSLKSETNKATEVIPHENSALENDSTNAKGIVVDGPSKHENDSSEKRVDVKIPETSDEGVDKELNNTQNAENIQKSNSVAKKSVIEEVLESKPVAEEPESKISGESSNVADIVSTDIGFGDLFGDDNPFFQALQQLQDTNKKAKEFEEKVKAGVPIAEEKEEEIIEGISKQDPEILDRIQPSGTKIETPTTETGNNNIQHSQNINQELPGFTNVGRQQQNTAGFGNLQPSQFSANSFQGKSLATPVPMQQSPFTDITPKTRTITVLNQGLPQSSSAVGLVQRIASPVNLPVRANVQQQLIQVQRQDGFSPPTVLAVPNSSGRSGSPLTVVQRVNSPLGSIGSVSSGSTSSQVFRVITHSAASQGNTPSVRYITTPKTQTVAPNVIHTPTATTTPMRTVQSMPRILPMNSQFNQSPGSVFSATIGPDGRSRIGSLTAEKSAFSAKLTDRDVSRLWVNEDLKLKNLHQDTSFFRSESPGPIYGSPVVIQEDLADEEEDEELGIAETYAEYMPAKLKIGQRHPDPVVESSSLSSVEPQDVHYRLNIPETTIDYGYLSALQLETITYCCQKHEGFLPSGQRAGFLIGDGAGVGKGRTIAGIIFENYSLGRKRSLWLSVSNDLRVDAERDLRDIGAKIDVHPLNKFKYAKISSSINNKVKKGVIFATYSSLIGESSAGGKYRTRFKQLIHWLGKDFDGLIVYDECHRAKNLCPVGSSKPTKTGLTVLELQNKLPKARVVYASATGASEPRNMAYMTRLGLWGPGTPFKEFMDFIQAVEKRGVGAMELVAMDMKLRGMYIARQLSFKGVTFRIEKVPIAKDFTKVYNEAVKLWVEAREAFQKSAALMGAEQRTCKTMWGQFWSSHQRFFKYLCIHAKLQHCVAIARNAIKAGKCVVIGLQSTGEARTMEALEEYGEITDFVSTAKGVFQSLVERHFPAPNRKKTFDFMSLFDESPLPSPKAGNKRKKDFTALINAKRRKEDWSDESDSDSNDKKSLPSTKKSDNSDCDSDKDSSDSDNSEEDSEDSEQDDFNPFGDGDDSDDDPWLKKSKRRKKEKKSKKSKEKSKENHKEKKKKKKEESDDEFDNIDKKFDSALFAAGLKMNKQDNIPGSAPALSIGADDIDQAAKLRESLMLKIERLGDLLPPNTLDQLIDDLGGTDSVAEMTGRKSRVVTTEDGSIQYESRSEQDIPLEILNLAEKQRFMDGEKLVAVISEAASSGISLQADRRAVNQRRRVHITLELPWSADRAIQQFGRTHRSNQVSGPEYIFLISDLAGERRFASTVSKRLESLGALTHGDRRATESRDLSQFNIDNKYGKAALEYVMKSVLNFEAPLVPPPKTYPGNFFPDAQKALVGVGLINYDERYGPNLEKDYNNISKFLNRILGMEVDLQNHLFQYFTDTLTAVCLQAKRNGRWDMGILDLGSAGETVKQLETKSFVGSFSGCKTKIELNTMSVERGMGYNEALRVWHDHSAQDDGFYLGIHNKSGKRSVMLAVMLHGKKNKERIREKLYNVYKPNTGLQGRPETMAEIKKKYKKVLPDDARAMWEDQYNFSATMCSHIYWKGMCRRASMGHCEVGLRSRQYYILSGSVLSVWTTVERVLASTPNTFASRMQIIRLRTDDGKRIVGTLIPQNALKNLIAVLSQESRTYSTQHGQSSSQATQELSQASNFISMPQSHSLLQNNANPHQNVRLPQSVGQFASTPNLSQMGGNEQGPKQFLSMPTSFF